MRRPSAAEARRQDLDAALFVGAGFPTAATLHAIVFGLVEMITGAGLATWFSRPT
ncbi:hypothetical protein [Halegenticoccus soli]|uniref:hypothetical protein n=1 Tax=Halegenticoccus soli TaxID=1985678 RepID=UPI001E2D7FCA|nr:hypothetical protein [Halegenticoccus soli]